MPFSHIVFDLDETLYDRRTGLMDEISRRITLWLQERLSLSPQEANEVRQRYVHLYGTTLAGLQAERPSEVDVEEYLAFVHDVPVEAYLRPDPALASMLAGIPLRRAVFTNANVEHALRVLRVLGVAHLFDAIVDIRALGMCPKPWPEAYRRMLEILGVSGPACILVEDRAVNLQPAKRFGITTVLVDGEPEDGVDFTVRHILEVGPLVRRLLTEDVPRGTSAP
ncbi:MAG: pyrimidine 5'-nucleotidase [Anaerolineae bacterium]|nr:pyrimidine 5'-nucleotidase [Anaerolineae bacterium]MCX8066909.1 pyrimidine 5'-nucleotidase [Anaerolineae bacterium]MDW7990700.1 pyrimidine 5'-nucleotidase [Anaerolineae bacterium]